VQTFGPPRSSAPPPPAGRQAAPARREAPWFRHCRRARFCLQDAMYRRLKEDDVRRARNLSNAQSGARSAAWLHGATGRCCALCAASLAVSGAAFRRTARGAWRRAHPA
jgi:hypothetical protein